MPGYAPLRITTILGTQSAVGTFQATHKGWLVSLFYKYLSTAQHVGAHIWIRLSAKSTAIQGGGYLAPSVSSNASYATT